MELTSGPFLGVMAALSAVCFAGAVWLTGRLHGRPWHAVARAVVLLVTCAVLMVTLGVKLNDDNGWYTSWSDLFGAGSASATSQVGSGHFQARSGGAAAPAAHLPALPSPGRRVQTYRWRGPASGVVASVTVVLPAGYRQGTRRTYPVIEAFHGIPGSPGGWVKNLNVQQAVDRAVALRHLARAIVVIPQIDPAGRDTECVNSSVAASETWLTKDVPALVRTHLRADPAPDHWATMGYSAGGWCAAEAAMLHPDVYGAAISLGGYVRPDFPAVPAGWTSSQTRRYDLTRLARRSAPRVALWLQTGRQSEFWPQTEGFLAAVRAPTSVTSVVLASSGHRFDVWQNGLPGAFTWLGRTLPGFAPH